MKVDYQTSSSEVFMTKFVPVNFQSVSRSKAVTQRNQVSRQKMNVNRAHICLCGLLRHKQITQPGQTQEVPVSTSNGDRANYDLACLLESEMSLVLGNCSVCKSPMRKKPHLCDFHSHRCQEQEAKEAACFPCYTKTSNGKVESLQ